jgi:hypothetical protein
VRIAVVHDRHADGEEARRRDQAFADTGWTVRTATFWLDHLDELVARLPDVEGSTR